MTSDELQQQWKRRFSHAAMIKALQFKQFHIRVLDLFEHSPQIGILLVSPQKLLIAIARDQQNRSRIRSNVRQRSKLINDRTSVGDTTFAADREMRDGLPLKGMIPAS